MRHEAQIKGWPAALLMVVILLGIVDVIVRLLEVIF